MCRTGIFVLLLAALAVSAYGVQDSTAHTHRKSSSAALRHHAAPRSARRRSTPRAARHDSSEEAADSPSRRRTPEEVGREAGLKIRAQMAQQSAHLRRYPAAHRRYRRAAEIARAYRPQTTRIPRLESSSLVTAKSAAPRIYRPAPSYRPFGAYPGSNQYSGTASVIPQAPVPNSTNPPSIPAGPATPTADPSDPVAYGPADTRPAPSSAFSASAGFPGTARPDLPQPIRQPYALHAPAEALSNSAEQAYAENAVADAALEASYKAQTMQAALSFTRGRSPIPLRGNLESLERQNQRLAAEGLERIENEDDLAARIANHLLVPVPTSSALGINGNLPETHRYCRPWTARFLADLAEAHRAAFHRPLQVSSAVRTVEYQKRLMLVNGNAAPAEGDIVSPHLTGATVDIAKDGLSRREMSWMRAQLLDLELTGKIDVEEEFLQSCFHITVYRSYTPQRPVRRMVQARSGSSRSRRNRPVPADESAAQGV